MPKKHEAENIQKTTKDRIFRTAVHLFATKGYHGTSMRDLAGEVGIKESSLYNHYKGKEAILDAILEYMMNGFRNAADSIDKDKMQIEHITDPVQFWLAGAAVFLKSLPELNEAVSVILINEMYLNEKCRRFYLHTLRPIQKSLTRSIFAAMKEKGMLADLDLDLVAEQYVYFLEGIRIEHRLLILEGSSEEELNKHLFAQLSLFIRRMSKTGNTKP